MQAISLIGVVAAFSLIFLSLLALCVEHGFRPDHKAAAFFKKLSPVRRLLLLAFVGILAIYAGTKDDDSTNAPLTRLSARRRIVAVQPGVAISESETNLGYRVLTVHDGGGIVPPAVAAVTNEPWRLRGGMNDAFRIGMDPEPTEEDWVLNPQPDFQFPWRDSWMFGLTVFANGRLQPSAKDEFFPQPFETDVSLVPQGMWGEIANGGLQSLFWHELTPSNSLVLTWQNALYGREANCPTNFQAELFDDGSFDYRYPDRTVSYVPVFPFDWDGDGLENSVDPEPLVAGADAHGTNAEWYNTVCSNVFTAVEGDEDIELSPRHSGVNTNAYYFVDVVAERGPAPIYFMADRDSRLGSPAVVAEAGTVSRVPLLIGIQYMITSSVPITVSSPGTGQVEIFPCNDRAYTVRWPLDFEFIEEVNAEGRAYVVEVAPSNLGGEFNWNDDSEATTSLLAASPQMSCTCFHGAGNVISYTCTNGCGCSGDCRADGEYRFESAVFSFVGGTCRCGFDDPPCADTPVFDSSDGPSLAISFNRSAVLFEEAYQDYPGDFKPKRSTRVRLTISAYGGTNGGRVTLVTSHLEKLSPVACGPMILPTSIGLAPCESYYTSFLCEASEASESENDVAVSGELVETGADETIHSESTLTIIRVEIRATVNPPDENYAYSHRHTFGVAEQVQLQQTPASPTVSWNPDRGGDIQTTYYSSWYSCPLFGCENPVSAECGGASYVPRLSVIEPSSVQAKYLHGVTRKSVKTYSVVKGQAGGIGMWLRLFVCPLSVSFTGIEIEEVPQFTYRAYGYFTNPYYNGKFSHTELAGAGNWSRVRNDNSFGDDEAAFWDKVPWLTPEGKISSDPTYAWTDGCVYTDNPFGWGAPNRQKRDPPYKMFATDTKAEFMVDANGTVGVRKLFHQVTRTTNDVIRLNMTVIK